MEVALLLRTIDDIYSLNNMKYEFPENNIGQIEYTNSDTVNLSFREACNKIIHAESFMLYVDNNKFMRSIKFNGAYNKCKWTVVLDIKNYVTNGISLAMNYGENWEVSSRRS